MSMTTIFHGMPPRRAERLSAAWLRVDSYTITYDADIVDSMASILSAITNFGWFRCTPNLSLCVIDNKYSQ